MAAGFANKIILVTGATSGIGLATARAFALAGGMVVLSGRREDRGAAAVAAIHELGGQAEFIRADMTLPEDIANLFEVIAQRHGRLDVAFNNAGIAGDALKPLHEHTLANWQAVLNANLTSVFLCLRHELAMMQARGAGSIVNNASTYGLKASNAGHAPYAASKHGVISLTRTAAVEYARANIRINAVCPGWTHSEMVDPVLDALPDTLNALISTDVPMNRVANADEIANAVLWLASSDASYVTGHALCVDGGWVAR